MDRTRQGQIVGRRRLPGARMWLALTALGIVVAGCRDAPVPEEAAAVPPPPSGPAAPANADESPAPPPAVSRPTVIFLGDSLTSGFGLDEEQAYPALVGKALAAEGSPVRVVNAGVDGDTTAGGLARLDWLLRQRPDVLVVGLGGNDGLRGLDLQSSEENLRAIVERGRAAGVAVVLLGMRIPPNYGPDYVEQFEAIYPRLAEAFDVIHVPFLLEGVGGERALNLPDGLHPNVEGHEIIARTVLPFVREALAQNG